MLLLLSVANVNSNGPPSCIPGEYNLQGPGVPGGHVMRSNSMQSPTVVNDGHYEYDSEEMARLYLISAMEVTQNEALRTAINGLLDQTPGGGVIQLNRKDSTEVYRAMVSMEAYLWKKGKSMFHMLSKRYYLLSGNCMYYYTHKSDVRPRGKDTLEATNYTVSSLTYVCAVCIADVTIM